MGDVIKLACIQMTSGSDINKNLDTVGALIRKASAMGANFIATPENTCYMKCFVTGGNKEVTVKDDHIGISFFSDLAKELGIKLLIGSMLVKSLDGKEYNSSFLFSDSGNLIATYDKIHLFNVTLPTGESHRESDYIKAGDKAVIAKINDDFTLGMSICYDLRFPKLYHDLVKNGANILSIPAAFTVPTGKAHWEVLLRARAIETGSYVIAPAQVGSHYKDRNTYGHSMIIDPWGRILEQIETGVGIIMADLNIEEVKKARSAIPVFKHERDYVISKVDL